MTFSGETAVFRLPDGTEVLAMHWPASSLTPTERWHAAIRQPGESWGPPLEIVRVEEGT